MSTQNSERIEDLIRCFLFAKILVPNLKNIWITIISILKEKHHLLSEAFIVELFSILFTSTKKPYFMNFLYDVDIWYLYGKTLLKAINSNLNTLINRFKIKKTILASILSSVYKIIPDKVLIIKYLLKFAKQTESNVFLSHAFNLFASADLEKRDVIKTINFFLTKNNKFTLITEIFTFDEIVDVMANLSKSDMIIDLLKMITLLSTMKTGYITNPARLSLPLIPHLMYHKVWISLFQIATGRKPLDDKSDTPIISFSDKFLVNEQILPLIVSLIGFSFISLAIIYTDENKDKNEVKKLEDELKESITVISNFGRYNNQLFLSHDLFDFILFFTPLFYDPSELFSDQISILSQIDKITTSEPNMKSIFNIWSFSQDFYQIWMKNRIGSPPIFTFTFIAFFAPLVSFYAPAIKFPLSKFEKFPEFLIAKVSEVSNFLILFLASSLNDLENFKKLFDTIVFTSPYKKLEGYSKFAVTLIVNFLTKRDIYLSPLESLEYLFKSIALELKERTFGDDNKLIITSCLTSLNALSNAMQKTDFIRLTFATRQILALTFDVCKITEISGITNLLAATPGFLYNFRVFDDFTFSGGFLIKMANSLQDDDQISSKFFDEFVDKIILSDAYLKQFNVKFDEEEFYNLMRFINGVKVLINRGKNGYYNWISSNQEVYASMTEILENMNKTFLGEIENDREIVFNNTNISEKIREMSSNLQNQTNKTQSKKFYLANSIEFLQVSFLNVMLRITETNMSKEFIKHNKLFGQSIEYFHPKSYRLSQTKLPVLNSRIMAPSNYELPHVEFSQQSDTSDEEKSTEIAQNSEENEMANQNENNDEDSQQNKENEEDSKPNEENLNKNEDENDNIEENPSQDKQNERDNAEISNELGHTETSNITEEISVKDEKSDENNEDEENDSQIHVENEEKHVNEDVPIETDEEICQNPIGINDLVDCFQRNLMNMFTFVSNKKFLPTTYSGQTVDDNLLNYINFSFVTTEDKESFISKFNAKLLYYTFSIDSAVFQLKSKILILLNANLTQNNELILEKSSKNDSLFEKLSQSIFDLSLGNFTLFAGHFLLEIPISSIIYSQKHLINHKQNGILFSTLQTGDIILYTNDNGFPSQFLNIFNIENDGYLLHNLQLSEASNLWSNGTLNNFEYLSLLNAFSGRSFVDLAQYPVFPWVIADYESKLYPQKRRNLEKVMGQLSEERAKIFDVSFQTQGYYYGCHYSMPASVHYFLFRIPPFLFFEWDLHGGWDNKDRMFFDIERSWISSSVENTNDVKELLPEFYSIPDFLTDKNEIKIEKVTLPPYSSNPVHFIMIQREELEKAKIENGIDLIFGFKQTGTAAIQAQNVFMPTLYHNYVMKEDVDPETISLQLENWGQCPIQLFKKKHQSKTSLIENPSENFDVFENNSIFSNLICYINKEQFYRVDKGNMSIVNESNLIITDKMLCFATKIDVSSNECFCVVDFSNGFSRVYRLQSGLGSEKFPLFPHDSNGFSKVNGQDLIAGTTENEKNLILWDFVRGRILRVLKFDEKIIDFCFDEY
ncbi:Beige/BEACH domain containing protein [Trichomonas vaginalis G3]|uniref:Beige/BEACH domain containing protein n=1 Tax=Trichomonas vaginalis (strain ATCC PRA-98 / G3) TaxID=412133 RepID=A2EPW8_TRIV3|nr:aggrephagy protein [Trichomonas vaginalis G3]EAY05306.1 Beige/BEACH domain containing protein [Trichomonas vaginalis G3]KAI5531861.1 aggrephagy protein [Trichomonas vaginalis G3]|eukprot:XP_001317529.1 Beige/BEACH domain containing protein [Trichomonas vaginalis G3]